MPIGERSCVINNNQNYLFVPFRNSGPSGLIKHVVLMSLFSFSFQEKLKENIKNLHVNKTIVGRIFALQYRTQRSSLMINLIILQIPGFH